MNRLVDYIKKDPLSILLLLLPITFIGNRLGWGSGWIFFLSAVGVIPMAGYIGKGTEALASYMGPRLGGLLNATLGNAAELIITLIAIRAGHLQLVLASITGSIIGNLLLVLGAAILFGGLKNGKQQFNKQQAGHHATQMAMLILALIIPSIFSHSVGDTGSIRVEALSLGVSAVMILLYALGLLYSLKNIQGPVTYQVEEENHPHWSKTKAFIVLVLATVGVVILSEMLVGAVEHVTENLGLSEFFLGIILIPIVGNAAEHLIAVQVAIKNKMDLSVEIAISSSVQIALFVAPLLVFVSLLMGNPLTLEFNQFELIALIAGVMITILVSIDGESNWLEGVSLIAVYLMLGLGFFLIP